MKCSWFLPHQNEFENRKKPTTCYVWETSVYEQSNTKKARKNIYNNVSTTRKKFFVVLMEWRKQAWGFGGKWKSKTKKAKTNCLFYYFRTCTIAKQAQKSSSSFLSKELEWLENGYLRLSFNNTSKQFSRICSFEIRKRSVRLDFLTFSLHQQIVARNRSDYVQFFKSKYKSFKLPMKTLTPEIQQWFWTEMNLKNRKK